MDGAYTRFYLDAITRAAYPEDVLARAARFMPRGFEREVATAHRRLDFLGVNYYTREVYRWAPFAAHSRARLHADPTVPRNAMGWEIWPDGLYRFLVRIRDEYGNLPVYITENGLPTVESADREPLSDPDRIAFLRDHLAAAARAIGEGCDCRGYFHWTFMDNFEWACGWTVRFGLLRTAPGSLERQWRASADWYRELVRSNALEVAQPLVDKASAGSGT
jgi:beta-glucosidase